MVDYLVLLAGDPPDDAQRIKVTKGGPDAEKYAPGNWALISGTLGDRWDEPDTVAELRSIDAAVLRTKDPAVLGYEIHDVSPRGGATPLVLADPSTTSIADISDRQFAQILALDGVISQDEALAWASYGELPIPMEQALLNIPEEGGQRFGARMLLASATTYERGHPLVPMLGALLQYDADDLDDIWRRAAAL